MWALLMMFLPEANDYSHDYKVDDDDDENDDGHQKSFIRANVELLTLPLVSI